MDKTIFINNFKTTLSAPLAVGGTELYLASYAGLPALGTGEVFLFTLYQTSADGNLTEMEVVKATAFVTDHFTVVREHEGAALSPIWPADTACEIRLTTATLDQFLQVLPGGDTGTGAIAIQRLRNTGDFAGGGDSVAIGNYSDAGGFWSIAAGPGATASAGSSAAFGSGAFASGGGGLAAGFQAKSRAGFGVAVGPFTDVGGVYGGAFGVGAEALSEGALGFGRDADARAAYTAHTAAVPTLHTGDIDDFHWWRYSGSKAINASISFDATVAADDVVSIAVPTGAIFHPSRAWIRVEAADTVTVPPGLRIGSTTGAADILGDTVISKSAVNAMVGHDCNPDGVTSLLVSVTGAATATELRLRVFFEGIMVYT